MLSDWVICLLHRCGAALASSLTNNNRTREGSWPQKSLWAVKTALEWIRQVATKQDAVLCPDNSKHGNQAAMIGPEQMGGASLRGSPAALGCNDGDDDNEPDIAARGSYARKALSGFIHGPMSTGHGNPPPSMPNENIKGGERKGQTLNSLFPLTDSVLGTLTLT
ncbi:hypothetical protein B0T10DRAFT_458740 [Thelonectria olida]|uniref:Uncharacterized protein n=1 Tax=Thelonectria olida TaxID=1576542 RepID=A0A9P8W6X4_9HYPO|nr:hypothetical protein B0T10DRAFT_458740 [Thelonectria olida]